MTKNEINQSQKEIIKKYENLITQIATIEKEKDKLMEQFTDNQKLCTHSNVEVSDSGFSAVCPDCGLESASWYCPESPDMECDYVDPDTDVYDEDVCIYCSQPYERK